MLYHCFIAYNVSYFILGPKEPCAYGVKINAYVQNPQTNANIAQGTNQTGKIKDLNMFNEEGQKMPSVAPRCRDREIWRVCVLM